jgi:hypothetical protein
MMSAAAATIQIGSPEHRHILARFFLDSHVDYVPEAIIWPRLNDSSLARLTGLQFWQEAVSTENITSNTVAAAARLEADPEIRKAIEMQGFEENRHARLLMALTSHYRIKVDMPPRFEPRSLENAFLRAGFGECFDSFFAFGLFALGQRSGNFAPELIAIFEPVVQEEARHILFFVNWVKYRRSQLPWWKRPAFRLRCAYLILDQVASRVKTARILGGSGNSSDNFTLRAHQEIGESVTLHSLLKLCLHENERRMAPYDARLRRPRLVPAMAKLIYRLLPARI